MATTGQEDRDRDTRLRQRLWGAAVLIAVLVIVLPLLLDGAGSESQFRRVERLREEPPVVLDGQGRVEAPRAGNADTGDARADLVPAEAPESAGLDIRIGEDDPPDYLRDAAAPPPVAAPAPDEPAMAWVVQAGSFGDEVNALAVRDRLRRAGYPSFVAAADGPDGASAVYRVRVGPMIERERAGAVRDEVVRLLGREAIVTGYP